MHICTHQQKSAVAHTENIPKKHAHMYAHASRNGLLM